MDKHSYYRMLASLRVQRNRLIDDFRHFKRDRVNRIWLSHSAFSHTVTRFRQEIATLDKLIAGFRLAINVSKETGVIHWYDFDTNSVYMKPIIPSMYTAK